MKSICQRYTKGANATPWHNEIGDFYAVVDTDTLPSAFSGDDRYMTRGFAAGVGSWWFFKALPPALAFGRAARMSAHCNGYGVNEAACETQFCDIHEDDEMVLLIGPCVGGSARREDEVDQLKLFVQGVKENSWTSSWIEPTGFITDYNNGHPARSRRPSLPL